MFNNLIESSSHRSELKRRGSFFLFTTVTYSLLFVLAGVASIYAYDTRLGEQNLELVTMMAPVEFPIIQPQPPGRQAPADNNSRSLGNFDEREVPMASVNRPDVQPTEISTTPNKNEPIREGITTIITGRDRNADLPGGLGNGREGSGGTSIPTTIEIATPPPPLEPKPKPTVVSKGVITSEALSLPRPGYPQMARMMRLQGRVSVQVLIDETGKVISARAVDGHPLFRQVSETAAFQARFSPTKLGDQAVKVSGIITYNFILQ